eukprot:gene1530-1926_t
MISVNNVSHGGHHSSKSDLNISGGKRKETIKIGEYALGDKIGKGAFGQVFKGLNSKTGEFVAIKQIDRCKIESKTLQSLKGEIEILQKLKHNNIVKVLGCLETQSQLNFILEYVENGTSQLSDEIQLRYSVVGTPYWMAPESIQISGQSTASDIWSLACTMIEMINGNPPYFNLQPMSAMFKIVQDPHPPYPSNISKDFENFLDLSFEKDPTKRPTAQELLRHPIFKINQNQLPTLSELQDTLKTLNGRQSKHRASISSIDWGSSSGNGSSTSLNSSNSSISSASNEEVLKLQKTIKQQANTIQSLSEEVLNLKKELKEKANVEDFYKEYFMALAISVKVNECYLGKNTEVNLQTLYEQARLEDIAWYNLMEWIPKRIISKSTSPSSSSLSLSSSSSTSSPPSTINNGNNLSNSNGSSNSTSSTTTPTATTTTNGQVVSPNSKNEKAGGRFSKRFGFFS